MLKKMLIVLISLISSHIFAQDTTYQEQYELEYQQRIKLQKINGRYIPKDLNDAMTRLDVLVDAEGQAKFKAQPEDIAVRRIHFSFGKWMIVNWGFYEGSRLSHYLRLQGITYPDDMATTLMTCFHRHLNGKPLEFEKLATEFAEKRRKEVEERLKQGRVIESKFIPKN